MNRKPIKDYIIQDDHLNKQNFSLQFTLVASLKACAKQKDLHKGSRVHADILRRDLLKDNIYIGNSLVSMYAKCGALAIANKVFDELHVRDAVSWNALIAGYSQHGHSVNALNCFHQMRHEGIPPNARTFVSALKACGNIAATGRGIEIHAEVVKRGLLSDNVFVGNAVLDMYAKSCAIEKAQLLFDELPVRDIVTWNTLIAGYAVCQHVEEALSCYYLMQHDGLAPDTVTLTCILTACGSSSALDKGNEVHAYIIQKGLLGKDPVLGNALVDMYAECGALRRALEVLKELPVRHVASWNALMSGYAQHKRGEEALKLYNQMKEEGISPDEVTFSCLSKACGSIRSVQKGSRIYNEIVKGGLMGKDSVLSIALVDMFVKCGALKEAVQVFDELPFRDTITWTALIAGYAQQGHGVEALRCFQQMQQEGISPDPITHTCIVELFARAGHFDEAVDVIKNISMARLPMWFALLGACCIWGNVELGELAFEHALQLNENSAVAYVCMSNIYATAGMQDEANKVESMRMMNEAWKKPGCCWWTDDSGNTHLFDVRDEGYPQAERIYAKLDDIAHKMSWEGYCPYLHLVSEDIPDDVNSSNVIVSQPLLI